MDVDRYPNTNVVLIWCFFYQKRTLVSCFILVIHGCWKRPFRMEEITAEQVTLKCVSLFDVLLFRTLKKDPLHYKDFISVKFIRMFYRDLQCRCIFAETRSRYHVIENCN